MNKESESDDMQQNLAPTAPRFPVVGIGASAGGVEALTTFFEHLPPDSGMAFLVILHLPPDADSNLAAILERHSAIPVQQVAGPVRLAANQAYVLPTKEHLEIVDGTIQRAAREPTDGTHMPIDHCFRMLAEACDSYAATIVLSGTGSDGALGIGRIKEAGGVTLAQDPQDAEFDGMPRSAIGTGLVDFVQPAAALPATLISYWQRAATISIPLAEAEPRAEDADALRDIFALLRVRTGHDFSQYKRPTISRRLARRMQVTGAPDLHAYLGLLRTQPDEVQALLGDLLISVTNFFRDRDAWAALHPVIPQLLAAKGPDDQLRVWVVACATGEEAYSVAILLREWADTLKAPPKLQVFATDIDDEAIAVARQGVYPATIAVDVSPARLQRFFVPDQHGYRIRQELRDLVLFARHNVLHDPPFSRVDLITCRNLLIYLNRDAQETVLQTFHFSLRSGGYLLLGSSESVDGALQMFTTVDKTHRLFQRQGNAPLAVPPSAPPSGAAALPATPLGGGRARARPIGSFGELHGQLITAYTPPSVIVNDEGDIVHLQGGVGQFLRFGDGDASQNLLRVVLPDLRLELRTVFFTARQGGVRAEARGVRVNLNGGVRLIDVIVQPIAEPAWARGSLLVVLHDVGEATAADTPRSPGAETVVAQLEAELDRTKFQLRATVEQYEAAVEEYKAANEELQAINEELRAASEELETSKEELQAINEELSTVNGELKHKVDEVSRAHNDLQNLITSTQIGTIFLDRELRIKRYTPSVQAIFNIIPADQGRPLEHVTHTLQDNRLIEDAAEVLQTLVPISREVETRRGQSYLLRVLPYRTIEDRIDGVVLTFVDITERKQAEAALRKREEDLRLITDHMPALIAYHDREQRYRFINAMFPSFFGVPREQILGRTIREQVGERVYARLRPGIERALAGERVSFEDMEPDKHGPGLDSWTEENYIPRFAADGTVEGFFVLALDITVRKRTEAAVEQDLRATQMLRDLAAQLTTEGDIQVLYDEILETAIALTQADAGTIQRYDEKPQELVLLAAKHIPPQMTAYFARLSASAGTSCGLSLATGERAIIDFDAPGAPDPDGSLNMHVEAGLISAQSTPLIARSGQRLGMFTTHWRQHRRPTERELRFLDLLARQAADVIEQRQADEALRESEALLQKALSTETVGVLFLRLDGSIIQANESFVRMTGYSRDELLSSLHWKVLTPPEFMGVTDRAAQELATLGETAPYEKQLIRKDGSRCWGLFAPTRLSGSGSAAECVEFIIDISERKEAEEQIRQSEQRLRVMIENLPGGAAFIVNRELRYMLAEGEAIHMAGLKTEDFIGKTIFEALAPTLAAEYETFYRHGLDGEPFAHEHSAHGRSYISRGTPLRTDSGEVYAVLVVSYDITARKQAEEALRLSEANFRAVANLVPDLLWSNDRSGHIDWYNQRWLEYTGQTLEEAAGYGWLAAIHPDDHDSSLRNFQTAVDRGAPLRQEYRIRGADGEYRWFLVQAQPVRDATGAIVRWYGAATNIHEERIALTEVRAALQTRDQFLSIASHELRTPLTALLGYTHLLPMAVAQGKGDPVKMTELITRQTQRLNTLIDQLLDVSRLQRGQFAIEQEPVDLAAVVAQVVGEYRAAQPPDTAYTIELSRPEGPVMVVGDAERLEQVIQNLLSNAVKYSPDGGPVQVRVLQSPGEAALEVVDQGIGIPAEAQAHLFDAFYRASNVGAQASGFGLGLHIVNEIVQRHGGRIEVVSSEGQGSTFRVVLPRRASGR